MDVRASEFDAGTLDAGLKPLDAGLTSLDAGLKPRATVAIFAAAIFTGSSLLFLVQPMFAKMVLPRLGGSSSVWNTCVLFFQTVLLLGYVYAHVSTKLLGVRRQALVHLGVLMLPFVVLPLSAGTSIPASTDSPVFWLLATMAVTVGLPFFVVSTTAPLLQRWFATFPLASAKDPYFLYSASNLGSMIALLGYPFLMEPAIGVRSQTAIWTAGYGVLVVVTASCALMTRRRSGFATEQITHAIHSNHDCDAGGARRAASAPQRAENARWGPRPARRAGATRVTSAFEIGRAHV